MTYFLIMQKCKKWIIRWQLCHKLTSERRKEGHTIRKKALKKQNLFQIKIYVDYTKSFLFAIFSFLILNIKNFQKICGVATHESICVWQMPRRHTQVNATVRCILPCMSNFHILHTQLHAVSRILKEFTHFICWVQHFYASFINFITLIIYWY